MYVYIYIQRVSCCCDCSCYLPLFVCSVPEVQVQGLPDGVRGGRVGVPDLSVPYVSVLSAVWLPSASHRAALVRSYRGGW